MLSNLKQNAFKEIERARDLKSLEGIYRQYLGRKGELTQILRSLKDLSEKERKEKGQLANQLKQELTEAIKSKSEKFQVSSFKFQDKEWIDVTAPGLSIPKGHLHPITLVQRQAEEIFQSMSFSVEEGPEAESEYYNFDALNTPADHPSRTLTDTFWLKLPKDKKGGMLLRTHTSPMQVRYMEKHKPPLRIVVPGRCFRPEATDAFHEVQFYQLEGLMVADDISVANFKGIVETFFKRFFGPEVIMRLRPSFFPFTEPSFEVDIKRKVGNWLEVMGAGMVHQNVFKAAGYARGKYQGFAFGVGLDRLAMLKYQINDIRLFYSGDLRFLKQF